MNFIERLKEIEKQFQQKYNELTAGVFETDLETLKTTGLMFKNNKLYVIKYEDQFYIDEAYRIYQLEVFNLVNNLLIELEIKLITTYKNLMISEELIYPYRNLAENHITRHPSASEPYQAFYKNKRGKLRNNKEEAIQDCIEFILESENE